MWLLISECFVYLPLYEFWITYNTIIVMFLFFFSLFLSFLFTSSVCFFVVDVKDFVTRVWKGAK